MQTSQIAAATFSVHSGWAAMVVMGCSDDALKVLWRRRVDMMDPLDPESKQPYHALEALDLDSASRHLASYCASALALATCALRAVTEETKAKGYELTDVGVLESSARVPGPLAAILKSHAQIHSADGIHFRQALALAGSNLGLTVHRVPSRTVEENTCARLGVSAGDVREIVGGLGHGLGPPWGADQKFAAVLALFILSGRIGPRLNWRLR